MVANGSVETTIATVWCGWSQLRLGLRDLLFAPPVEVEEGDVAEGLNKIELVRKLAGLL